MDLTEIYDEGLLENAKEYLENPDLGIMASALSSNPDNKDNLKTAISIKFKNSLNNLNHNLKNLNKGIRESSKTSSKNQRWLIIWTIIMALAVIGLLIFLAMTTKMEGIMLLVFPVAIIYLLVQD